ncbi:HAD hydrolase family protein, partial [Escherichia coli]|uniref:HAD hydrolase family protein n=2 Tax=Escherichia coli TaxID=562 RepID=UPI002402DA8A
ADRNRSHWSTSKTPSYTKSVSWQHHRLRQLQKLWGIDDSEVVVFGDGGNDIEMLRQAGFSFAMENAGSAVVAAAKYRAGSNNREGVLDVIDKVLKHEAPFDQ